MSVSVATETWFILRWPEKESGDVRSLVEKLFKYKNKAGFQNDGLNLTRRDRDIIKQIHESFDTPEEEK